MVAVLLPLTIPAHPPRIPVHRRIVDRKIESIALRGLASLCRTPTPLAIAAPANLMVVPSASFIIYGD